VAIHVARTKQECMRERVPKKSRKRFLEPYYLVLVCAAFRQLQKTVRNNPHFGPGNGCAHETCLFFAGTSCKRAPAPAVCRFQFGVRRGVCCFWANSSRSSGLEKNGSSKEVLGVQFFLGTVPCRGFSRKWPFHANVKSTIPCVP